MNIPFKSHIFPHNFPLKSHIYVFQTFPLQMPYSPHFQISGADLLDEPPQLPAELLAFAAPGVVPGAAGFSPRTPAERLRPHQRRGWGLVGGNMLMFDGCLMDVLWIVDV